MAFTITIKKEVQVRTCKITVLPDGSASVTAYADGVAYITDYIHASVDQARTSCESVQLGGVVHWQREGSSWLSASVLCFQGGIRLAPWECDLARKALSRCLASQTKAMLRSAKGVA
jgi:hypothetical protein